MLSAIFWLPPFLQYADQRDLDLDSRFRGGVLILGGFFFFNSLFWVLVYGRRHCVADIDLGSLLGLFLVCGFLVLGCDDRSRVFLVAEEMLEK